MDSLTHIYFAHKLLSISDNDISASVCSLFPQIDREPAYFHRMYGHPFFQISQLARIGSQIYKTGAVQGDKASSYAETRFIQDRARMKSFAEKFETETGISISPYDPSMLSIIIGYVSHTYQDIFNNPMQAFLPYSVYPCGKWELWSELNPIEFRTVLYHPNNITQFRNSFFGDPLWNTHLDGMALIKAMVSRTAAACTEDIPQSIIDKALEGLEVDKQVDSKAAEEFLIEHEYLLSKLIKKYSTPSIYQQSFLIHPVNS